MSFGWKVVGGRDEVTVGKRVPEIKLSCVHLFSPE